MNLAFMTKWGKDMPPHMAGKPTYFPEKILESLVWNYPDYDWEAFADEIDINKQFYECTTGDHHMKPHTIREDKNNRWKAGNKIHFQIWLGKPYRSDVFQFAPIFPCVSTQKIEICWCLQELGDYPPIFVDGRQLTIPKIQTLAINDGFDTIEDFFSWFNQDFVGKIIHWTPLRY